MLRRMFGIFLVFALAISFSAAAQPLDKAPVGTVYKDAAEVGRKQVPLPGGDWVLAAKESARTTGGSNVPLFRAILMQEKEGKLHKWVYINTNLDVGVGGWTRDRAICDRADVHHNASDRNYNAKDTECWIVNHYGQTLGANPSPVYTDFFKATDDKGRPATSLGISFFIVKDFDFLTVLYNVNPELEGFEKTPTADWRGNPWHRDMTGTDAKKLEYISKLKLEGEGLLPLVKDGFRGRLKIPATSPAPRVTSPASTQVDSLQEPDVVSRLRTLEDLLGKGLISREEFDTRRKAILDRL